MEPKKHTLMPRMSQKEVWPQSLINMLKGVGCIHTSVDGKMYVFTEYSVGEETGADLVEILVKEELETSDGGGI